MSSDEDFLGARASRPHKAWHGLAYLRHLDRPAASPWLSLGPAVTVPADVVAACKVVLKLSDPHKEKDAGGTPALPGANHSPLEGESQKPSPKAKADAVGGKPGDSSGAAKRRQHLAVGVSPWNKAPTPPSRVGGDST